MLENAGKLLYSFKLGGIIFNVDMMAATKKAQKKKKNNFINNIFILVILISFSSCYYVIRKPFQDTLSDSDEISAC